MQATTDKYARTIGLRYGTDTVRGIRRVPPRGRFRYVDAKNRPVTRAATLARIKSLVIPPAWTDVWISPHPKAHLQATGRDARGRKQYRYHTRWKEISHQTKYSRMVPFARALPKIRRQVSHDLRDAALCKTQVLAAVLQLLEKTLIRVGNEEYARTNGSFGLTTLRDRHVRVRGGAIRFEFKGKSGVRQSVTLTNGKLAKSIKRCLDLPGQELFQYVDEHGRRRLITSADVNEYLRQAAGESFSAKDFRTWAGTLKQLLPGKILAALDDFRQLPIGKGHRLTHTALAFELEANGAAADPHVAIAQRREPEGAVGARVLLVAHTDQRFFEEL